MSSNKEVQEWPATRTGEFSLFRWRLTFRTEDRVTIHDHEFMTYRTLESHGIVFFWDTVGVDSLVLGKVHIIFLVTQGSAEHVFLAIHCYLTPLTSLLNPFACYPDFGASLWSSDTQKEITIVLGNRDIYHAIYWDWDYKIVVMKPLDCVVLWCGDWRPRDGQAGVIKLASK